MPEYLKFDGSSILWEADNGDMHVSMHAPGLPDGVKLTARRGTHSRDALKDHMTRLSIADRLKMLVRHDVISDYRLEAGAAYLSIPYRNADDETETVGAKLTFTEFEVNACLVDTTSLDAQRGDYYERAGIARQAIARAVESVPAWAKLDFTVEGESLEVAALCSYFGDKTTPAHILHVQPSRGIYPTLYLMCSVPDQDYPVVAELVRFEDALVLTSVRTQGIEPTDPTPTHLARIISGVSQFQAMTEQWRTLELIALSDGRSGNLIEAATRIPYEIRVTVAHIAAHGIWMLGREGQPETFELTYATPYSREPRSIQLSEQQGAVVASFEPTSPSAEEALAQARAVDLLVRPLMRLTEQWTQHSVEVRSMSAAQRTKLAEWTERMRSQGIANPEAAARTLIEQQLV